VTGIPGRYSDVKRQLARHRLLSPEAERDGWPMVGPLESGHYVHYSLDQDPESGERRWSLSIRHGGDPTGSWIRSDLGADDSQFAERLKAELRHRDVVKAMGDQWRRATEAGDPHGLTSPMDQRWQQDPSHAFRHYG
jgi:hypothetical protein